MRRMITDKLTKNIKEVVKAYDDGEIALTEDIPTKTSDLTNDSDFITINDVPEVVANPTLVGDEANLTGLQVGDTKYAVPQGGGGGGSQLYAHNITISVYPSGASSGVIFDSFVTTTVITNSATAFTADTFLTYMATNFPMTGPNYYAKMLSANGLTNMIADTIYGNVLGLAYMTNEGVKVIAQYGGRTTMQLENETIISEGYTFTDNFNDTVITL